MAHALEKSSVAVGGEYNKKSEHGENDYTLSKSDYSTVVGAVSKALEYGSIALGHSVHMHLLKKLFLWASIQKQKGVEVSL